MKYTDNYDKTITSTFINAQKKAYTTLLNDIETHDYTTISEIKGAIKIELDSLDKLEKGRKYELSAKLDHTTEGQFPNV